MSLLNGIVIVWSALNIRTNTFEKVLADKPLDEMTDDEVTDITNNATSCQVFVSDKGDVPAVMEELRSIREMLGWKGDITEGKTKYEDKKTGKIVKQWRVGFNRDKSRSMGILAFKERLAGIAR